MEIGVIGIESAHVRLFAEALGALYPEGETGIKRVWCGDAPYSATGYEKVSEAADLITRSDAVIIALRNGMHHADHAVRCLEEGKPVFVDKPFALVPEDADRMIEAAKTGDTLLTGGSALCYLPKIAGLREAAKRCKTGSIRYWSDPYSPYGGWPFYGIHACDLCTAVFGSHYLAVAAYQNGGNVEAHIIYPTGKIHMITSARPCQPVIEIDGSAIPLNDSEAFFYAMQHFTRSANRYDDRVERLVSSVHLMNDIFAYIKATE